MLVSTHTPVLPFIVVFLPYAYTRLVKHAADLLLLGERLESVVEGSPPLKEHGLADELEPRGELERRVLEHFLELLGRNPTCVADFVQVGIDLGVGLDEKDVINWGISVSNVSTHQPRCRAVLTLVLTPLSVAGSLVVDAGKELKVLKGNLLLLDTQLVVQFPPGSVLDTSDSIGKGRPGLVGKVEGVRAAGVCPHVGEGDLFGGALLKEELVLVVEKEDGEGPVKKTLVDVGHKMACRSSVG